jgi:hypothetical protein
LPFFLSDFNETWTFSTDFRKSSYTKFHENPSGGSRTVPCGRTDGQTDGRRDMTKLIVAIHNFANAPKNWLPTMKTARTANNNREKGVILHSHAARILLI